MALLFVSAEADALCPASLVHAAANACASNHARAASAAVVGGAATTGGGAGGGGGGKGRGTTTGAAGGEGEGDGAGQGVSAGVGGVAGCGLVTLRGGVGHFGVYGGEAFAEATGAMVAFFKVRCGLLQAGGVRRVCVCVRAAFDLGVCLGSRAAKHCELTFGGRWETVVWVACDPLLAATGCYHRAITELNLCVAAVAAGRLGSAGRITRAVRARSRSRSGAGRTVSGGTKHEVLPRKRRRVLAPACG